MKTDAFLSATWCFSVTSAMLSVNLVALFSATKALRNKDL